MTPIPKNVLLISQVTLNVQPLLNNLQRIKFQKYVFIFILEIMILIILQASRSGGGRYKNYNNNDSYGRGGYKSQDYGQQSGYQHGGNDGGYDYSQQQQQQYSQYYAQYGYDQSQFSQAGQDGSNNEGQFCFQQTIKTKKLIF